MNEHQDNLVDEAKSTVASDVVESKATSELNADSPSGALWRIWFNRMGAAATADVVNATSELVIGERDLCNGDTLDTAYNDGWNDAIKQAAKVASETWAMVSVGKVRPENQAEVERTHIVNGILALANGDLK